MPEPNQGRRMARRLADLIRAVPRQMQPVCPSNIADRPASSRPAAPVIPRPSLPVTTQPVQITAGGVASAAPIDLSSQVTGNLASVTTAGTVTSSSPSAGVGYAAGAGGTVTQGVGGKNAAVTINKMCGTITMNNANLNAQQVVSFTVNNTSMGADDVVHVQHDSVGTLGAYMVSANSAVGGTSFQITVRNVQPAGSPALGEAIVLRFAIIKAAVT